MAEKEQTKHEKYWAQRAQQREQKWFYQAGEFEKELKKVYEDALLEIQNKIYAMYQRFAVDNKMSLTAAQKLIKSNEHRKWRMSIETYVKKIETTGDEKLLFELNTLAMRSRITRLDKLYGEILLEHHKLAGQYERKLSRFYNNAFQDGYYRNLFDIQSAVGVGLAVAKLDPMRIKAVMNYPWSGANYSSRIWDNTEKLAKVVKQNIVQGMVQGVNAQQMSRNVANAMGASYRQAETLIRTELSYINNQAALESMKDAGVEKYRFIATLDNRTSPKCRALDGKTFKINEVAVGTNMPPMHVRCRSSTAADFNIKSLGKRIARDDEGKNIHVPADMKYTQWKEKYIDVNSKEKRDKIKETVKESVKAAVMVKAASILDAEKYARESLGFTRASYKNIDLDVANKMNHAISDMYAEYPMLKGFVQEIRTDGRIKATAQAGMHYKNGQLGTVLTLSSTQLNHLGDFQKLLEKNVLQKWWSPKDGVSGVIRHELAHMLEYSAMLKRNGLALGRAEKEQIDRVFVKIKKGEFSSKIGHEALKNLGIETTPKAIAEHLSAYASKSSLEFLAEAVSEHQPRALAAEVVRLLKKELEGIK